MKNTGNTKQGTQTRIFLTAIRRKTKIMIYHTYNEYKAACQTVDKMLNNPNRSGNDTKELLLMLERIKLTEQSGIYG